MLYGLYRVITVVSVLILPFSVSAFEDSKVSELLKKAKHTLTSVKHDPSSVKIITLIDYNLPSTDKRLWVLDLDSQEILFHEYVAHGVNSGELNATEFSNEIDSKQSSLGLFLTQDIYHGKHGISLRLEGLQKGLNHNAKDRYIVFHGASYVSEEFIQNRDRLGLSWGCPALPEYVAQEIIETIAGGTFLFIYHTQLDKPVETPPSKRKLFIPSEMNPPNFPKA